MAVGHATEIIVGADVRAARAGMATLQRDFQRFTANARRVGRELSLFATLPIGLGLGSIVQTTKEFETQMNRTRALVSSAGKDFEDLTNAAEMADKALTEQAKTLGQTTVFSAIQAAQAQAFLAQTGFDATQIISSMPAVLDLAAAGQMEVARTADIASNVLKAFGLQAEQMTDVADVMAQTFRRSNVSIEQIGESMKLVAPTAASLGLDMVEVTAAIGLLGDAGLQGTLAGTSLNQALTQLTGVAKKSREELASLGITAIDQNGQFKDLTLIIEQFVNTSETNFRSLSNILNVRGARSVLLLINRLRELKRTGEGLDLRSFTDELRAASGVSNELALNMQRGIVGALTRLKSSFEGLKLSFGTSLIQPIIVLTTGLLRLTEFLTNLEESTKRNIVTIALLTATAGPLILGLGVAIKTVVLLSTSFRTMGLAVIAVGKGVVGLTTAIGGLFTSLTSVAGIMSLFIPGGPAIRGLLVLGSVLGSVIAGASGVAAFRKMRDAMEASTHEADLFALGLGTVAESYEKILELSREQAQLTRGQIDKGVVVAGQRLSDINQQLADNAQERARVEREVSGLGVRSVTRLLELDRERSGLLDDRMQVESEMAEIMERQLELRRQIELRSPGTPLPAVGTPGFGFLADTEAKLDALQSMLRATGRSADIPTESIRLLEGALEQMDLKAEGAAEALGVVMGHINRARNAKLAADNLKEIQSVLDGIREDTQDLALGDDVTFNSEFTKAIRDSGIAVEQWPADRLVELNAAIDAYVAGVQRAARAETLEDALQSSRDAINDLNAQIRTEFMTDLERARHDLERERERLIAVGAHAEAAVFAQEMEVVLENLRQQGKFHTFNIGGEFADGLSEGFSAALRGTREFNLGDILRDASINVGAGLFESTLREKLSFDVEMRKNLLEYIPGLFRQGGDLAARFFGDSLTGIGTNVATDITADASVEVGKVAQEGLGSELRQIAMRGKEELVKGFGGLFDGFDDMFAGFEVDFLTGFRGMFGGLLNGFTHFAQSAIEIVSTLAQSVGGFAIQGIGSLFSFLGPFATGGIVPRGTRGFGFFEGRQDEAVIPLDRLSAATAGGGGGAIKVEIINNASGVADVASVDEVFNEVGERVIRIAVERTTRAMAADFGSGGPVSRTFETAYGTRRR